MTAIVWFRRDLRIHDHSALFQAVQNNEAIIPLLILDDRFFNVNRTSSKRLFAFLSAVQALKNDFRHIGGDLLIMRGNPTLILPQLIEQTQATQLYFNRDYSPYARDRDRQVWLKCQAMNIPVNSFKDLVLHEPKEIHTHQDQPYKVFTPYKKKWLRLKKRKPLPELNNIHFAAMLNSLPQSSIPKLTEEGFDPLPTSWEQYTDHFSQEYAQQIMIDFMQERIHQYLTNREIPAVDGTSRLSVHLRVGTISIRQIYAHAMEQLNDVSGEEEKAIRTFITELCWRDFYVQILYHFPHTIEQPFRQAYQHISWNPNQQLFEKWCSGNTGIPIIDAAMRQLNQTGWMHNRLRMVTASFLTKNLFIDWRKGMAYFEKHLLDGDTAANTGGWQWSASVGTDAQPYFRVFNPVSQGEKFDHEGSFVRTYLPVLNDVPNKYIHRPWDMTDLQQKQSRCIIGLDYAEPIVDLKASRKKAIQAFKEAKDHFD